MTQSVDLRRLKDFALQILPKGSTLREVLLTEEDEVTAPEFIGKVGVWLRLMQERIDDGQ